jgi:2-polyprenyl-3-methyl-5-hydroxy-6-metoxy-1,4-benzoquinol methylase
MSYLKELWLRTVIRGAHYRQRNRRLDALYWVRDPWKMQSPREAYRFDETNRIIKKHFGQVDRMLEVGCGEGHQSVHFLEICKSLYGIDVSHRAVLRAKRRCPSGIFDEGDVFNAKILEGTHRFDLVVACEVLYYMENIPAVLNRFSQIGSACFVTYYRSQRERLDPYFAKLSDSQKATIGVQDTGWRAVWWRGELPI